MTALILALVSLSLLPYGWGYSITSSLGPTFNPSNPSPGSGSSGRVSSSTIGATTVSPVELSEVVIPEGASSPDGDQREGSHYIRVRDSNRDYRGPYSAPNYDQNQYTPTQLQMASRILFESRATTPKPYLGYRSFITSYRNQYYFVKPSKNIETVYGSSSKHPYPPNEDEGEEERPIEEYMSKQNDSSSKISNESGLAFKERSSNTREEPAWKAPTTLSSTVDATTLESKTAPATDISLDQPTDRPSSTQQMRSDGTYFTGSESNNHYQITNNNQWIRGYQESKRPVQISSPDPSLSSPPLRKTVGPCLDDEEKDFDYDSTSSSHNSESSRELEEETIAFPTTTNPSPKPFYKLPGHPGAETNFSSVKNIVELRHGGNVTGASSLSDDDSNKGNKSTEKLSPVPDGKIDPSCANTLGYCDSSNFEDSYPKEIINSVLTNSISSDLFKKIFSDVDGVGKAGGAADFALVGRTNVKPETPLCHSQEVTIYPRAAKNKEDKWMFIVNHDDYIQGVKVEKCTSEGNSCLFGDSHPLGYESVCRQKFILRKLVALNDEGKTSLDTFKLPSCCVCFLKSINIEDRTGVVSSASQNPVLSDKASNSSGQSDSVDVVAGASEVPTECSEKKQIVVETASNRNASSLLPDMSRVNLNSTNANLTQDSNTDVVKIISQ